MSVEADVKAILHEMLQISDREVSFERDTALLGALPEFDSMVVVSIIGAVEERFDVFFDDDEIDGSIFETVGTFTDFVAGKVEAEA